MIAYTEVPSPVGPILVAADEVGIRRISFPTGKRRTSPESDWVRLDPIDGLDAEDTAGAESAWRHLAKAASQLTDYFAGTRRTFDLPLAPEGTAFQQKVWNALSEIPYGETVSYGQLARRIGRPEAARAVGAANGRNPLPIVVPCHRVVGADGSLTGFAGGLATKQALLDVELASA